LEIGDCHRFAKHWSAAEAAYRRSVAIQRAAVPVIYLAECVLAQDRPREAFELLDGIDHQSLDSRSAMDYAYAYAAIATALADLSMIDRAISFLSALSDLEPHFEQRRLKFIVQLQSAKATGTLDKSAWKHFLRDPLRAIARYGILQPNVAGIGLNINAMLEDATKQKK
jgi:hypothetical protein